MKNILAKISKNPNGVTLGVCSAAYIVFLGVDIVLAIKRYKKEMETQELIQKKINEGFEEITAKTIPKMGKEIAIQVQETQRVPNRINPRQNIP